MLKKLSCLNLFEQMALIKIWEGLVKEMHFYET